MKIPELTPHEVLQKYWGYPEFRPQQHAIISSVLEGKDTFALLPTGGGKSLCYQVPGLCKPGLTIVISPLIALMKDQVYQLKKREIAAEALTSDRSAKDIQTILDQAVDGKLRFLYLSPEKLQNQQLRATLVNMPIQLIAVDEAHCISEWGYDFRPSYLQISEVRELIPEVPVLAVTATATPDVVDDIQSKLNFPEERVFKLRFLRENLAYRVVHTEHRWGELLRMLQQNPGSSIVYVRNRRGTEEIASFLNERGISADFYHAGLDSNVRASKQEKWTNNTLRVMVSTNAFGMGIDKPDVRTVFHADIPESPEAYFQEAGRAGRDGNSASAILIVTPADIPRLKKKSTQNRWKVEGLRRVYRTLCTQLQIPIGSGAERWYNAPLRECAQRLDVSAAALYSGLQLLERLGILKLNEFVGAHSQVKFVMPYHQLYQWQSSNAALAGFTRDLLRQREGFFEYPQQIDEWNLAANLGISKEAFVSKLEQLQNYGVIEYVRATGMPQIMFFEDRVDEKYLRLDENYLENRYRVADTKVEAMITYVTQTSQCRSQYISAYFGETDAPECGLCDWCTHQPETQHRAAIVQLLTKKGPINLDEALDNMRITRAEFGEALRHLLDEQIVRKTGNLIQMAKPAKS